MLASRDQVRAGDEPVKGSHFLPLVPRWSAALSAPPAGPPVIAGDLVVVPLQNGGIVALKVSDGTGLWRVELSADRPATADGDRIYVASRDAIHALSPATGETIWRAETGALTAPPLVRGGWVVAAAPGSIAAFRATDGSSMWRRAFGPVTYRPAIDGDLLYVPLLGRSLAALQLQSGETRWESPLGGEPGEPLAVGGKVYAAATDKFFYALDADDGALDWRRRAGAAPRGAPVADEDHVYFVAMDNVLRALDRGHGALEWAKPLRYRPAAGPVLAGRAIVVPGAITTLPVFATDGTALANVTFFSTLVAVSNVTLDATTHPMVAAVTGDLQHPWTLWLFESSTAPPAVPMVELTVLPGITLEIAIPQ